ncbi:uncharacterized protein LOC117180445 [Belonocnema kinseyi]|uniref:uncharacterized protein LOC117180445 n=1 Tax=Belonocnema kinseyi TaxID=2817044 RepID=UPI00143D00A2|nr:uncharacterized protein LOC117180445 [Belonocnema kinseyi]
MPRHKYVIESRKPTIDANALVAAVKEILIEKKALRSVARAYNIDKSRLFRYISKLNDSNLDPSTASEEKLIEFLSSLSTTSGGRTIFSEAQEKQLMTYLLEASKIYYGLSINELKILTYELAKNLALIILKHGTNIKKRHMTGTMGLCIAIQIYHCKNKPRMNQGRPSGRPLPLEDDGETERHAFPCEYPGCGMSFGTKRGLGVHRRAKHPEFADQLVDTGRKNKMWSHEENLIMARREAEMALAGERFLNQELAKEFPQRSYDSI